MSYKIKSVVLFLKFLSTLVYIVHICLYVLIYTIQLFICSMFFCLNFKVSVAGQDLFFNPTCVVKSDATVEDLTGVYGRNYLSSGIHVFL